MGACGSGFELAISDIWLWHHPCSSRRHAGARPSLLAQCRRLVRSRAARPGVASRGDGLERAGAPLPRRSSTAASPRSPTSTRRTLGQRRRRRGLRRGAGAAGARRHAQAPHLQPDPRHQARLVDRHDRGQRRRTTTCAAPCAARARQRVDPSYDPHEPYDRTPLDTLLDKERWASPQRAARRVHATRTASSSTCTTPDGLEAEEVAAEMQISLKTVYSKKHKIRAHLKRCLRASSADRSPTSRPSAIWRPPDQSRSKTAVTLVFTWPSSAASTEASRTLSAQPSSPCSLSIAP